MKRLLLALLVSTNAFAQGKAAKTEIVGRYQCDPTTKTWKTLEHKNRGPYRPVEGTCPNHAGIVCTMYETTQNDKQKTKTYRQACR